MNKFLIAKKETHHSPFIPLSESISLPQAEATANREYEMDGLDEVIVVEMEKNPFGMPKALGVPYRRTRSCKHLGIQLEFCFEERGKVIRRCPLCNLRIGKAISIIENREVEAEVLLRDNNY